MKEKKIYDCFLFFQEFEILELRLKYLYEYVDLFIVVEFNQTFAGNKKNFNLEGNLKKFSNYLDKLFYYKIDENLHSFNDLIAHLNNKGDSISKIIAKNMLEHRHYDRNEINWVIDTYQRESIYYALNNFKISEEDLIIISDIDEIPNYKILEDFRKDFSYSIVTFKQNAFSFFLNLLSSKGWYGSIVAKWGDLNYKSLNFLRLDVRNNFELVKSISFPNGGYHFTSIGSVEYIKNKIKNMGHQELNNNFIISKVEKNIYSGRDIFGRSIGQKNKIIDINDSNFFDLKISKIIKDDYNNLLIKKLYNLSYFSEIIFFFGVKIFKLIHIFKVKIGLIKKI